MRVQDNDVMTDGGTTGGWIKKTTRLHTSPIVQHEYRSPQELPTTTHTRVVTTTSYIQTSTTFNRHQSQLPLTFKTFNTFYFQLPACAHVLTSLHTDWLTTSTRGRFQPCPMSESRSRGTRLSATVSSYSCCFFGPPSVYGCGIEGVQYLCVGVYRTCLRTWRYLVQYLLVSYTTWITQVSTTSTLLPPVSIPGHHRSVPWSPAVSIPGHHRSVSLVTSAISIPGH